jgi:hypothetical protein
VWEAPGAGKACARRSRPPSSCRRPSRSPWHSVGVMSSNSRTVAIVAVAVTGAVSLVGTVGNWVYQARSEHRRFERERVAADLDELRALLDEGARALTRYDESRAAVLRAAWRRARVDPALQPADAAEARDQFWAAKEANSEAQSGADDLELRLLISRPARGRHSVPGSASLHRDRQPECAGRARRRRGRSTAVRSALQAPSRRARALSQGSNRARRLTARSAHV